MKSLILGNMRFFQMSMTMLLWAHMTNGDRLKIAPAVRLSGVTSVPGDKSISHRLAMLGGIAEGPTVIRNFAESVDCQTTLNCLRDLGVPITRDGSTITIDG